MSYFNLVQGTSVSTLFRSLSNSQSSTKNTSSSLSFLSDYASIRNGSYKKLLNAYYKLDFKDLAEKETISTSKISAENLTSLQKEADSLQEMAKKLYTSGKDSVFLQKEVKQENGTTKKSYDTDGIYKEITKFVDNYNELLDSSEGMSSASIGRAVSNLKTATEFNRKFLTEVGIETKSDGSLSIDEKKFKDSDMRKVESLFKGIGSYGYQIFNRASKVEESIQREVRKANTYNKYGNYSQNYNYSYQDYM